MSVTPFENQLRTGTYYDTDQHAAAWRLFASSIQSAPAYTNFEGFVNTQDTNWQAYELARHNEKLGRFNFTRNITTPPNLTSFNDYNEAFEMQANKRIISRFNNLLTHLSNEYGVSRELLASVSMGRIYAAYHINTKVLQDCMTLVGATQIIQDIPKPNIAGATSPVKWGNGGKRKSVRRRKSKPF